MRQEAFSQAWTYQRQKRNDFPFPSPFLREPNASLVCFYSEKEGKSTIFWGKKQNSIWQYKEKEFKASHKISNFYKFQEKKPLQLNKIV